MIELDTVKYSNLLENDDKLKLGIACVFSNIAFETRKKFFVKRD